MRVAILPEGDPLNTETVDRLLGEYAAQLRVPMYAKDRRDIWAHIDELLDRRLELTGETIKE